MLVAPENAVSLKLCERLGFRREEIIWLEGKEYCRMMLYYDIPAGPTGASDKEGSAG